MTTEVKIPSLGAGMIEGTVTEWLVTDGAKVSSGDVIYTLESEKTAQDVESPASGTLSIIGKAGETFPVGELIAKID